MSNRRYLAGVRLERNVVNLARQAGYISFRSAGSHSPIDVVVISPKACKVWVFQCKASKSVSKRLKNAHNRLWQPYEMSYNLVQNIKEAKDILRIL